ncbi:MAG TPA: hypothetical protein IAD26_00585 [Candidatus Limenecus avicola]|uniref:Uncharacterized protein n=1 Tax=Candidatus Limenecus avicola TaxID=2840847 RepID=A0A9D1MY40_9CLOT|nr:hypothetical protein [Candidatus Limenecus avicola]
MKVFSSVFANTSQKQNNRQHQRIALNYNCSDTFECSKKDNKNIAFKATEEKNAPFSLESVLKDVPYKKELKERIKGYCDALTEEKTKNKYREIIKYLVDKEVSDYDTENMAYTVRWVLEKDKDSKIFDTIKTLYSSKYAGINDHPKSQILRFSYCENFKFSQKVFDTAKYLYTEDVDYKKSQTQMMALIPKVFYQIMVPNPCKPGTIMSEKAMNAIVKLKKDYNFSMYAIDDIFSEISKRTEGNLDVREECYSSLTQNLPEDDISVLPDFVKSRLIASLPNLSKPFEANKYKYSKAGHALFNKLYEITENASRSQSLTKECYSQNGEIIPEFVRIVTNFTDKYGTNSGSLAFLMNMCRVHERQVNYNAVNRLESLNFIKKNFINNAMSVLKGEKEDYPEESFEVFKANYDPNEPEKIINLFSAATDDNGKFCKNVFDFGKMLKDNGTDINTACMFMNASKEGEYIVKERYKAAKELLEMGVANDLIQRLINICCQNSLNSFYYSTHFNHNLMAAKKLFKTEGKNTPEIMEKCMDKDGKFDEEKYQSFNHILNEAFKKRDTLKAANEDLPDDVIKQYFLVNFDEFMKTVDIIGEKSFVHAFKYKKDGLRTFAGRVAKRFTPEMVHNFLGIANPEKSERYKILTSLLDDYKKEFSKLKNPIQIQAEKDFNDRLNSLEEEKSFLKVRLKSNENVSEKIKQINREIKDIKYKIKLLQPQNPKLLNRINELSKKRSELVNKAMTDPLSIVNTANIFCALSYSPHKLDELYPYLAPKTEIEKKMLDEKLNKMIFHLIDIDYDEDISKILNISSSRYLSELFSANSSFLENFKELVILLKNNPNLPLTDIFNNLEQNIETKKQFKKYGINYDKWVLADKSSFVPVSVELDSQKAKQNAVENIIKDFNDPLWKLIPNEEITKLQNDLKTKGFELKNTKEIIYDEDGYENGSKNVKTILFDSKPLSFEKMPKLISAIKESLNKNEFWSKTNPDKDIENARGTLKNHLLKLRSVEAENAQNLKKDEEVTLEVHKTDMNNIAHALFLGNHSQCCTAVGTGCNQWTAPLYIKNKMISGIEIMDGTEFVGNTMCWFALVDGKPALVLDNIELSNKYQYNDKIKDAIFEYSKKLLEETCCLNFNIYAGPNRHKLNMNNLEFESHNVTPIGSTGSDEIYMDYDADGHKIDGIKSDRIKLYKIK